jgi:hypothetical protein
LRIVELGDIVPQMVDQRLQFRLSSSACDRSRSASACAICYFSFRNRPRRHDAAQRLRSDDETASPQGGDANDALVPATTSRVAIVADRAIIDRASLQMALKSYWTGTSDVANMMAQIRIDFSSNLDQGSRTD